MATPCTKRRRDKSVGGEENGFMGLSHMPEGNLNKPARNHPQRKQFASGQKRGCSSIRYRSQPGHCAIGNDPANTSGQQRRGIRRQVGATAARPPAPVPRDNEERSTERREGREGVQKRRIRGWAEH